MFTYKGYTAVASTNSYGQWFGSVINLPNDVITFKAESESLCEHEFILSVDEYIQFSLANGVSPETPFSFSDE